MLLRRPNVTRFYVHIVTILTKKHSIGYSIQKPRVNSLIFGDSGEIFARARKSNFWRSPRVASPRNSARARAYLTHPTFARPAVYYKYSQACCRLLSVQRNVNSDALTSRSVNANFFLFLSRKNIKFVSFLKVFDYCALN